MKFKKYRKFTKKEISLVKFFYIFHKKIERDFKKYKSLYGECSIDDIEYCDVYSSKKEKFLFKKVHGYNILKEIFENEDKHYILFFFRKNKKSCWNVCYYDETFSDYEGQPCGNCGLKIFYMNRHKKYKNLKIILDSYN